MLGYVVSYKPEMKVREAELYKSYYCGVCKSIGNRYGQLPRMVLSYDAAFLALIIDSLYDNNENITRERCIAHPHKKSAITYGEAIDFSADVMLILAWYKILDDIRDEESQKAKVLEKLYKGKFEKLYAERRELCNKIEENLKTMSELEKEKCASIDEVAEAFAQIMEAIFAEGLLSVNRAKEIEVFYDEFEFQNKDKKIEKSLINIDISLKVLGRIGYHLGKWIYLIDAFDDIEDNIKTGAYNPLLYRFDFKETETAEEFKGRIKSDVERNLIIYLSEIGKAIDLLDIKKNKGILENIIYVGLLKKTESILDKKEEGENKNE